MAPHLRWLRLSPLWGPALPEMPRPRWWSQVSLLRGGRLKPSGGLHQACEALARQRLSLERGTDRQTERPRGVSDAVGSFGARAQCMAAHPSLADREIGNGG